MLAHGDESLLADLQVPSSVSYAGVYGRLFRDLPPFEARVSRNGERERHAQDQTARTKSKLARLAERLRDPSGEVIDNERIPAAYTYLGQFIAHDVSFDPTPLQARASDPQRLRTFRTPALDLDSVYGGGPRQQPYLFDARGPAGAEGFAFALGDPRPRKDGALAGLDLPRSAGGRALVADPRNDSHFILTQLHVAFLRFHNRMLQDVVRQGWAGEQAFEEARRLTRWHYQWIVVHDYLPRLTGRSSIPRRFLEDPDGGYDGKGRIYSWRERPFLPVEFTGAVFRFGHVMSRGSYDLGPEARDVPLFPRKPGERSLRGGRPLPAELVVRWGRFVSHRGSRPQASQRLRRRVHGGLDPLPELAPRTLSEADLQRGHELGLPSGQDVARAMGLAAHDGHDPLWYYVLKEAEFDRWGGTRLGPVARRIVTEVLLGLLLGDPSSFPRRDPRWVPPRGRGFDLGDFLELAGMPMS